MTDTKYEKTEFEKKLEADIAAEEAAEQSKAADDTQADEQSETTDETDAPAEEITELEAMTSERDDLNVQLLRLRAEFDNYRKRMAREAEKTRKTASAKLVLDLLPGMDNMERALDHVVDHESELAKGIEMVMSQFVQALSSHGVEPIAAVGEPFDPNVHEAMVRVDSEEYPVDIVAQEFVKGYMMGDAVLRPSQVLVSAGPGETTDE